tara:strand:- start:634 stop:876 length:243 start_codon:yes stop_codon:yes gene_type:complete
MGELREIAQVQLADFTHRHQRLSGSVREGDLTGAAGKGHGRTAHAGTQFEPHTEVRAKERAEFARQIANYIFAVAGGQCY